MLPSQRINRSGQGTTPRVRLWDRPWVRRLFFIGALAVLLGVSARLIQGAYQEAAKSYAERMAKARLAAELVDPPAYLSREILDQIRAEVAVFAADYAPARPDANGHERPAIRNYDRLRNPLLDAQVAPAETVDPLTGRKTTTAPDVLRELGLHFQAHQGERCKAWVRRVLSVERVSHEIFDKKDGKVTLQLIRIKAEYRVPLGFIAQGDKYYLVEKVTDGKAVRLPGEYSEADRKLMSGLLMVRGVDENLPEPGQPWTSPGAIAGLRLMEILADAPYRQQISAIDVSNFAGAKDPLEARIKLATVFPDPQHTGENTKVWWGLPPDFAELPFNQRLWEVKPAVKLKALQMLFARYGRIDAGQPYVDIRGDDVRIPKATTPGSTMVEQFQDDRPTSRHG